MTDDLRGEEIASNFFVPIVSAKNGDFSKIVKFDVLQLTANTYDLIVGVEYPNSGAR